MKRLEEVVEQIEALQRGDLDLWIREELLSPHENAGAIVFSEMECARIRLICTLHYDLEIGLETLPVILSLLDQLYQTRQQLLKLSAAVAAQDDTVRMAVLAAIPKDAKFDNEQDSFR